MAIISKFPGGGGAKPQGDLPPLHENMAMTTSSGEATVTMDEIPAEFDSTYDYTLLVYKYDSAPTSPSDGDTIVKVFKDGHTEVVS